MNELKKLSDEILQEQIRKTHNGSPHGIFSCRKLNVLINELAEYRRLQPDNEPLTCKGCVDHDEYVGWPDACLGCKRMSRRDLYRHKSAKGDSL